MSAPALWALTRPRGAPFVVSLPLLGYGWGHWDFALPMTAPLSLLTLLAAWWLLHAGTMWLNADLDRDDGEVLYGSGHVEVPDGVARWGAAALLASVAVAFTAGTMAGCCAAVCALLAVLYSHPSVAWKGHPVAGPAINIVGYGLLSPLAGWSLVGADATVRGLLVLVLHLLMVLGTLFASQAFQRDDDAARGYRTLVVTHGPTSTLWTARLLLGVSFVGFAALTTAGWLPRPCLVALPFMWRCDQALASWIATGDGGSEAEARLLVRRLLTAGGALIGGAYLAYGWALFTGGPGAGLGTVAGHG